MPEDPGRKLRVVASCTQAFAWLTVLTRCWVRLRLVKYFGLDDQLMVTAVVRNSLYLLLPWSHVYSFYSSGLALPQLEQVYMAVGDTWLTSHLPMLSKLYVTGGPVSLATLPALL
jgi:hypothetical protein